MASVFRKKQMASSEHFEYFVNFPLAGISLLFNIGYVVLQQVIANNLVGTSKTEQYRVFQKFVDILKSLYFIQISYFSLHFLADINKSYCLSIFRTFV